MADDERRFASSLWLIAGRVASRSTAAIVGFVGTVVWTRAFGKDVYGNYQIIAAAIAIVTSLCLPGLDDAALISSAKNKDGNLTPIIRQRVVVSVVGALALAAFGLVRYYVTDLPMALAFVIAAVTFVPIQLQTIWDNFANGKRKFRLLMVGEVAVALASLVAVSGFAAIGWTDADNLPWVVLGTLGLTAITALVLVGTLERTNQDRDPAIVRYGHHVTVASLFAWVLKSDRLIIGEVLSAADTATLAVALVLPNQVKIFFTAFEQVFLPKVTEAPSVAAAWDYIRPRMFRLWAAYTTLGVVGFLLLPVFIPLAFSQKYVDVIPYAKWLWLSLCLSSPFTFLASILNSQRDKRFLYIKNLSNPLIMLALFAILIPPYGILGAIVARIATHGFLVVLHVVYFAHALRISRGLDT